MSSKGRGTISHRDDYYVTPKWCIDEFLDTWKFGGLFEHITDPKSLVLDPSAGGDEVDNFMAYPRSLAEWGVKNVVTNDIRDDSLAEHKKDFLSDDAFPLINPGWDLIITNPPFSLAREFIDKALSLVNDDGVVVMLLPITFFGSQKRRDWWCAGKIPQELYIHSRRPSFYGESKDASLQTDSVEYAHFVWYKCVGDLVRVHDLPTNIYVI